MAVRTLPPAHYLRECFDYDPETGVLTWRTRPLEHFASQRIWKLWNTGNAGKTPGSRNRDGRICVSIDGIRFPLHNVVWKMMTGETPYRITHRNQDITDNRFANLAAPIVHRLARHELTQAKIREWLSYDPITGTFAWKERTQLMAHATGWNARYAGTIATKDTRRGYLQIRIHKVTYYAHRLAWIYMHGPITNGEIDHINGIRNDNRIANLRPVTRSQNHQNLSTRSNNTSGYLGVTFLAAQRKWRASGHLNDRALNLGHFDNLDEAVKAAHEWRVKNYPHYTGRDN